LYVKNASLEQVLEKCLEGQNLSYRIVDNNVVITRDDRTSSRQRTLTGNVTDGEGQPLAGVTVRIKGNEGAITQTDTRGAYRLVAPAGTGTLIFSLIGFVTAEIP